MAVIDDVEALIFRRPGLSEVAISEEIFGKGARQQQVNPSCRQLSRQGRVERRGRGGNGDPFTYYPAGKD
ncbi:MAG: hypothetical protein AB8B58_10335 [Roseobacter sp.]